MNVRLSLFRKKALPKAMFAWLTLFVSIATWLGSAQDAAAQAPYKGSELFVYHMVGNPPFANRTPACMKFVSFTKPDLYCPPPPPPPEPSADPPSPPSGGGQSDQGGGFAFMDDAKNAAMAPMSPPPGGVFDAFDKDIIGLSFYRTNGVCSWTDNAARLTVCPVVGSGTIINGFFFEYGVSMTGGGAAGIAKPTLRVLIDGTEVYTQTFQSSDRYNGFYAAFPATLNTTAWEGKNVTFEITDVREHIIDDFAIIGTNNCSGKVCLGNLVWEDTNGDGIADATETKKANVKIQIFRDDNDGKFELPTRDYLFEDGKDGLIAETTTDANGNYNVCLPEGDYFVRVTPDNFDTGKPLEGCFPTFGPSVTGNSDENNKDHANTSLKPSYKKLGIISSLVSLAIGAEPTTDGDDANTNSTIDFGVMCGAGQLMNLGNLVWEDANENGIKDAAEKGIDGVLLELYVDTNANGIFDNNDTYADNTTTAGGGIYNFANLFPGDYIVRVAASNFNLLYGALPGYKASKGNDPAPDTDNDLDNTDDGVIAYDQSLTTRAVTLIITTEPTTDTDGANGNLTVDIGLAKYPVCTDVYTLVSGLKNSVLYNTSDPLVLNKKFQLAQLVLPNSAQPGFFGPVEYDWTNGYFKSFASVASSLEVANYSITNLTLNTDATLLSSSLFAVHTRPLASPFLAPDGSWNHLRHENALIYMYRFNESTGTDSLIRYDNAAGTSKYYKTMKHAYDKSGNLFTVLSATGLRRIAPDGTVLAQTSNINYVSQSGNYQVPDPTKNYYPVGIRYHRPTNYLYFPQYGSPYYNYDTGELVYSVRVMKIRADFTDGEAATAVANFEYSYGNGAAAVIEIGDIETDPYSNYVYLTLNRPYNETSVSGVLYRYAINPGNGSLQNFSTSALPSDTRFIGTVAISNTNDAFNLFAERLFRGNFSIIVAPCSAALSPDPNAGRETLKLGNRVWNDVNNNGRIDGAEAGIANVGLVLYKDNGDGVLDRLTDARWDSTTTDASGYYLFKTLPDGDYFVWLPNTNFATGKALNGKYSSTPSIADPNTNLDNDDNGINPTMAQSHINDGVSSGKITLTLDAEPTTDGDDAKGNMTVDFGFYTPRPTVDNILRVGNRVWNDANNNIKVDVGETYFDGVKLTLLKDNGDLLFNATNDVVVATTTTAGGGFYLFDKLLPGFYYVRVDKSNFDAGQVLDKYRNSTGYYGANTCFDSTDHGNESAFAWWVDGVLSSYIALEIGQEPPAEIDGDDTNGNMNIDFGFYRPVRLGNRVWKDNNKDGKRDATEPNLNGVLVNAYKDDGDGIFELNEDIYVGMRTTQDSGYYNFHDLVQGSYFVQIPASNFMEGAVLKGMTSSPGVVGENPAANNQDHGIDNANPLNGGVMSQIVVLAYDQEPPATVDTDNADGNFTIDFGFGEPTFDLGLKKIKATGQAAAVTLGSNVKFTIKVYNQGSIAATAIQVTDYIPTGLTLNDANWTATGGKATLVTPIATLAAGDSVSRDINFTVAADATGTITNTAEISAATGGTDIDSTPDEDPANDGTPKNDVVNEDRKTTPTADEDDSDPESITITLCVTPTFKAYGVRATCSNGSANTDAQILITDITNGTKFGYSPGAFSYTGPDFATATAISGTTATVSGLSSTVRKYTVRIFNGANDCFKDIVVIIPVVNCNTNCTVDAGADQLICEPTTTVDLKDAAATEEWIVDSNNSSPASINATTGVVTGMVANGVYSFILRDKVTTTCSDAVFVFRSVLDLPALNSCEETYQLPTTAGVTWSVVSGTATVTASGLISGMTTNGTYRFSSNFNGCTSMVDVVKTTCACIPPNAGADFTICLPKTSANLTDAPSGYTWVIGSGNPAAASINATTGVITGMTATGIYKFNLQKIGDITCFDEVQITVTNGDAPIVLCDNGTTSYTLVAQSGITNVVWYNMAGAQVGTGTNLIVTANTTGLSDGSEAYYYIGEDGTASSCDVELCCPVKFITQTCCPIPNCLIITVIKN